MRPENEFQEVESIRRGHSSMVLGKFYLRPSTLQENGGGGFKRLSNVSFARSSP